MPHIIELYITAPEPENKKIAMKPDSRIMCSPFFISMVWRYWRVDLKKYEDFYKLSYNFKNELAAFTVPIYKLYRVLSHIFSLFQFLDIDWLCYFTVLGRRNWYLALDILLVVPIGTDVLSPVFLDVIHMIMRYKMYYSINKVSWLMWAGILKSILLILWYQFGVSVVQVAFNTSWHERVAWRSFRSTEELHVEVVCKLI